MRSAVIYNFLIEANIMASIAILLMIPLRKFLRRKLGNTALCFGWLMVALRLLLPHEACSVFVCGASPLCRAALRALEERNLPQPLLFAHRPMQNGCFILSSVSCSVLCCSQAIPKGKK